MHNYLKNYNNVAWYEKVYWRVLDNIPYGLKIWWLHTVIPFFFPRQKWLTKQIPKDWSDKKGLIPELLFACIVHFVEEEKPFEVADWDATEGHREARKNIEEIYRWVKGRDAFQERIMGAYPPSKSFDEMFKRIEEGKYEGHYEFVSTGYYDEVHRLEAEFDEGEKKHMKMIIDNLDYLWT